VSQVRRTRVERRFNVASSSSRDIAMTDTLIDVDDGLTVDEHSSSAISDVTHDERDRLSLLDGSQAGHKVRILLLL